MSYSKIILKNKKESSLLRFHPWVFSGAINNVEPIGNGSDASIQDGDKVEVYSNMGIFLGVGHAQTGSIAIRILSFQKTLIDEEFYFKRIKSAFILRQTLNLIREDNNIFRLIHGEGDMLAGLVVDVYDDTAVMQAHSSGMHLDREIIAKAIIKACDGVVKNVYYKSETTLSSKGGFDTQNEYIIKADDTQNKADAQNKSIAENKLMPAIENGIKILPNWIEGQKTGFFVDQRENRALIERYSHNKKVLNMFCYTGGFSLYALRGGAKLVHSVDSSAKAMKLTDKNIKLNFKGNRRHKSFTKEAFDFLNNMEENYDLIVLDPPAFAKHQKVLKQALQGYKHLNAKAFEKIARGGILFTFSCSQAVSKEQFRLAIFSAAAQAKRNVRILHQLSQPADHPINIYHPEGEYLKGLVVYVE